MRRITGETIAAHAPGAKKRLVVVSGELEVTVGAEFRRSSRKAMPFSLTRIFAHCLRNSGDKEVKAFLVVTGIQDVAGRSRGP